jgi:hypothetical protein
MDIMVERRRVTVFFDVRNASNLADQRRIEQAVGNARVLASDEAAGDAYETPPWAA